MTFKVEKLLPRRRRARWTVLRNYGSSVNLPPCEFSPKPYNGPAPENIERIKKANIPAAVYNIYKRPLLLHQGRMQWLWDHRGQRYLDLFGGIVTVSVGHCHPKVNAAVIEQVNTLWHTTNIYRHPKIYEYVEKLVSKLPPPLQVVYLVNSGSEANDLAVMLAKAHTGNHDVISLQGSYHGYSTALQGLTATKCYRMPMPAPPGYHHAMLPDPYRGLWGSVGCRGDSPEGGGACHCPGECAATDRYLHQLHELIEHSIPGGRVAAMFAESIQGVNGAVQFPREYLLKAKQLISSLGGLFVADEVQTGFGRLGDSFWGFSSHGLVPDIVTMAKGIGNGFPLAAVATSADIAAAHTQATYFNTFGGNALAATAGKAVLEVIEEEGLQQNSLETGNYFIKQLLELKALHPCIGDVRGKGLMLALELVQPGTKDPMDVDDVSIIQENIKDLGVLIGRGGRWNNVLRIKPPMCINKRDVDFATGVLDASLKLYEK